MEQQPVVSEYTPPVTRGGRRSGSYEGRRVFDLGSSSAGSGWEQAKHACDAGERALPRPCAACRRGAEPHARVRPGGMPARDARHDRGGVDEGKVSYR